MFTFWHQRISSVAGAKHLGSVLDVPIHQMLDELSVTTAVSLQQLYVKSFEQGYKLILIMTAIVNIQRHPQSVEIRLKTCCGLTGTDLDVLRI
jgi:hypothetical protein